MDPEDGTELKFVPAKEVNGFQWAKLEPVDVINEINYWQNAVLCLVLGANPPFDVLQGFMKHIWANFEIDEILCVRKGVVIV